MGQHSTVENRSLSHEDYVLCFGDSTTAMGWLHRSNFREDDDSIETYNGFSISQIGCHSLRSGSAMAMYLAHVPDTTIQLIGRWKSAAFMRYIREQVDCFTSNISAQMISTDSFFTIPDHSH